MLSNFRDLDFIKKIEVLTRIEKNKQTEYVSELFDLYNNPTGDDSIDNIIEETLRNLIVIDINELKKRIINGNEKEQIFCVKSSARFKLNEVIEELISLTENDIDDKLRYETLYALSELENEKSLEVFKKHIGYKDKIISTLAIEMVGYFKDENSIVKLIGIINDGESEENYKKCSIETAGAIDGLANFDTRESLIFFIKKIHHKNPTARRIIHEKITNKKSDSLPYLGKIFSMNNVDNKIMAANLIGRIGDKSGGDILFAVLDNKNEKDANLRYAIYEAFGTIKSLKGLICLSDALIEPDCLVLLSVIHSLDSQVNQSIIDKIIDMVNKEDEQSINLIKAIIQTKSVNIFKKIYVLDKNVTDKMINQIIESNDEDIIENFKNVVEELKTDRSVADLKKLSDTSTVSSEINILVVDDSKAMLMFYKNLGSETGFNIYAAENGAEALDIINRNGDINLIITDMNMPVMDGTELTRNLKANDFTKDIPLIMATTESDSSQIDIAKDSGVDHFIKKPFTKDFLFETIIKYLL